MSVTLVSLGERTDPYTFTARTLAEALRELMRRGPRDGDGHHAAYFDARADILNGLQTGIAPGSVTQIPGMGWTATAEISSASLRYGFVFRFPQWSNVGSLSRPVQAEWRRYTRCLWVHERGHVRAAMPVLRRYLRQFQGLRIASTGPSGQQAEAAAQQELRGQVNEVYRLMSHDVQQASDRYDRTTRHGRTQGARLRTEPIRGSRH